MQRHPVAFSLRLGAGIGAVALSLGLSGSIR
jgi:hypothetical protein